MVNNQCYVCHNMVSCETNADVRNKYYNIIGNRLYLDSNLCYICTHLTQKLWSFKNTCINKGVDVQYGCEEELNWSLLFRLTKDPDKLHSLQSTTPQLTSICQDEKCQSSTTIHSHHTQDFIQELYIHNAQSIHNENYFNFDKFKNHTNIQPFEESIDDFETRDETNYSADSNFENDRSIDYGAMSIDKESQSMDTVDDKNDASDYSLNDDPNIAEIDENCDESERNFESVSNEIASDEMNDETNDDMDNDDETSDVVNRQDDEENDMVEELDPKLAETVKRLENKHFTRIVLSFEVQKSNLEAQRREKKYVEAENKCHSCALGFGFKDSYQSHMVRHEESNGQYSCPLCSLRFATQNARRMHVSLHSVRYLCSVCDVTLTRVQKKTHMVTCWRDVVEPVSCHVCGKIFNDSSGLQQHLKRFHSAKTSKRTYTCNICGKKYKDQGGLRTHMIIHTNRVFPCPHCDRTYTSPYTLSQHKHTHTTRENYFCHTCSTFYANKKLLRQHLKNSSAHQQFSFECPTCSCIYPTRRALESHTDSIHTSHKPHTCLLCPASYSTRKSLIRHTKIHRQYVQAKEFVCHLCGKSYRPLEHSVLDLHCWRWAFQNIYHENLAYICHAGQTI